MTLVCHSSSMECKAGPLFTGRIDNTTHVRNRALTSKVSVYVRTSFPPRRLLHCGCCIARPVAAVRMFVRMFVHACTIAHRAQCFWGNTVCLLPGCLQRILLSTHLVTSNNNSHCCEVCLSLTLLLRCSMRRCDDVARRCAGRAGTPFQPAQ